MDNDIITPEVLATREQAIVFNSNVDKWIEANETVRNIAERRLQVSTALVLENMRLMQEHGSNYLVDDKLFELATKVYPNLLAHKIVSVQPALGPGTVGHYKQFRFSQGENAEAVISEQVVEHPMACVTRRLKTWIVDGWNVDEVANSVLREMDNEVLFDLRNNVGTVVTVQSRQKEHSVHNALSELIGIMSRKALKQTGWIVVNEKVYDEYKDQMTPFKYNHKIHVVPHFEPDEILVGIAKDSYLEHRYIYCPYVLFAKTPVNAYIDSEGRCGLINRYAKCLTRDGSKHYGKVKFKDKETA